MLCILWFNFILKGLNFGLTAEYPATYRQHLKIGGYANTRPDTQSLCIRVSEYPLCHNVSVYPHIPLVYIFKISLLSYEPIKQWVHCEH